MEYLLKPEKTLAEARAFVSYVYETYRITDTILLAKVVGVSKAVVAIWINECEGQQSACFFIHASAFSVSGR